MMKIIGAGIVVTSLLLFFWALSGYVLFLLVNYIQAHYSNYQLGDCITAGLLLSAILATMVGAGWASKK